MNPRTETVLSIVLPLCAVAVAGTYVVQELSPRGSGPLEAMEPLDPEVWNVLLGGADRIGPTDVLIEIVAFSDFQCPYCRTFFSSVDVALNTRPNDFALVLRHFPIPNHPFAEEAARAAVCGGNAGRFRDMVRVLFENQDFLGELPCPELAVAAGVTDTVSFHRCIAAESTTIQLATDGALVERLGIIATPTVFINGNRYRRAPSSDSLLRMANAAGDGET